MNRRFECGCKDAGSVRAGFRKDGCGWVEGWDSEGVAATLVGGGGRVGGPRVVPRCGPSAGVAQFFLTEALTLTGSDQRDRLARARTHSVTRMGEFVWSDVGDY